MRKQIGLLAISTFLSVGMLVAKPVYVSTGGSDANKGTSWQDAYVSITAALSASSAGDEVFVAKGTYNVGSGITLKEGVNIYGGFAGTEESITGRRYVDADNNGLIEAWELENTTVLEGNASGSVLKQENPFTTAVIVDGFTITGGKAEKGGGANLKGGLTLQGCIISGNEATDGGGVYLDGAMLKNSMVTENVYSGKGGGAYAVNSGAIDASKVINNFFYEIGAPRVGDAAGGGIIFYIDEVNNKYLVVSTDEGDGAWGNKGTDIAGADDMYNGVQNTADLDNATGSPAASWCKTYSAGGFSDWFLPSTNQLQQLYVSKNVINVSLRNISKTELGEDAYWSSTEGGANNAHATYFDTGYAGVADKSGSLKIRSIREVSY